MDKQSAIQLIKETFENSFEKERFVRFVKNLFNKISLEPFEYSGQYIPDTFKPYISKYERVGKYTAEDKRIDILIVYLNKETSIERARTMQRNFVAGYLIGRYGSDTEKDAAIVAFVSPGLEDWRFSLVKMEYKLTQTKTGRPKGEEEFTPARRYSFLVGKNEPNHTAQQHLFPILQDDINNPTLDQLEKAFSVEKVTDEFLDKYRELYLQLKDSIDKIVKIDKCVKEEFENKKIKTSDFSKKLLGQIAFLYFLQKKGWLGVPKDKNWGEGDKNFLRSLFNKCNEDLPTEASTQAGKKNFFNDYLEVLFYDTLNNPRTNQVDSTYSEYFDCRIPFLNGGLFEPVNNYNWRKIDIVIPNELFSNNKKTEEGDIGSGILDVFDRYNFTVQEDEPLEKEVALDPELLGKVFENLIEENLRKGQGAYYTPREIVHYMCQESLINYLSTELEGKVNKEDIEILIKYGDITIEHDKLVIARTEENPEYNGKYKKIKMPESIKNNAKLIDEKLEDIRVCDPAVGSGAFPVGMMLEIVKARNVLTNYISDKEGRTPYNFKRHCIENCLYGVDIDSSAIDIAKLRFWLSLIVDEEDVTKIKPLPNLDYKLVCGNSLLGLPENILPNNNINERIEEKKKLLFSTTSLIEKLKIRDEIQKLFIEQLKFLRTIDHTIGNIEFDFHIYFSEVFHEKKGFDVVIANPPYVDSESMVRQGLSAFRDYIIKNYNMAKGNWDIYIAFLERGFKILNSNGILTFITPDKWISKPFGDEIRKGTIDDVYSILKAGREIFESAKVDSIVSLFIKRHCKKLKIFNFENNCVVFKREIDKNILSSPFRLDFLFSDNIALLLKIESAPYRLSNSFTCENACATSDAYKLQSLLRELKNGSDEDKYLKVINTGTIGRYVSKWGFQKMTYLKEKYLRPVVNKQNFLKQFENTYASKSIRSKIIIKGLTLLEACLDSDGSIIPGKSTLIIRNDNMNELKFLLAIINSNLAFFYIKEKYPSSSYNEGINFTKEMINNLPTPNLSNTLKQPFIDLVDKILEITKDDDYLQNKEKQAKVKEYERQIDQMVYKLYGLTDDEIKIVEGNER